MNTLAENTAKKCFDGISRIHVINGLAIGDKHSRLKKYVLNRISQEMTQLNDFKDQMNVLKNTYGKTIPYSVFHEIRQFNYWRNQSEHENPNDIQPEEIDYLKNVKILATTISYFSGFEIPERVNMLYAGREEVQRKIENEQEKTQEAIKKAEAENEHSQRLENEVNEKRLEVKAAEMERKRAQRRADILTKEKQEMEEILKWQRQEMSKKKETNMENSINNYLFFTSWSFFVFY